MQTHDRQHHTVVFVLAALCLLRAGVSLFSGALNPDFYWHLLYGREILSTGHLPAGDWLTWSVPGKPYQITQWAGQATIAWIHRLAGEQGTTALVALVVFVSGYCAYRTARLHVDNPWVALVVVLLCNSLLARIECRPQIFSFMFMAVLVWIIESYRADGKFARLTTVPIVMALWVNFHGAYIIGLIYLAVAWGAWVTELYLYHQIEFSRRSLAVFGGVVALAVAATLANPYGLGAWQYTLDVLALKSTHSGLIPEWTSPALKNDTGQYFLMVLTALIASLAFASRRLTVEQLFVALAFIALGYAASRNLFFMGLVLTPVLARLILHTGLYSLVTGRMNFRLPYWVMALGLAAAAAAAGPLYRSSLPATEEMVETLYATKAIAYMKDNQLSPRVLNNINQGGYLSYNWPAAKIFIDGRLDLYGDALYDTYYQLMRAEPGWSTVIAQWRPDTLLLGADGVALREALVRAGWYRVVYRAGSTAVLVRETGAFQ